MNYNASVKTLLLHKNPNVQSDTGMCTSQEVPYMSSRWQSTQVNRRGGGGPWPALHRPHIRVFKTCLPPLPSRPLPQIRTSNPNTKWHPRKTPHHIGAAKKSRGAPPTPTPGPTAASGERMAMNSEASSPKSNVASPAEKQKEPVDGVSASAIQIGPGANGFVMRADGLGAGRVCHCDLLRPPPLLSECQRN